MHMEARMFGEPVVDRGRLVGRQVVADQVHVQLGGYGLVDRDQEFLELDRPMSGVELRDHGAVGDVECREQVDHAVTGVVVGPSLGHARHHRQYWLGTIQRLDLALFVDAQYDGLLRRIVVEADNIDDLLDEQWIAGQFEPVA